MKLRNWRTDKDEELPDDWEPESDERALEFLPDHPDALGLLEFYQREGFTRRKALELAIANWLPPDTQPFIVGAEAVAA